MDTGHREILKTAARDMLIDNLIDQGVTAQRFSDEKLAELYDEVMAAPEELDKMAAAEVAEPEPDPRDAFIAKAAERVVLGKLTAQAYAASYLHGIEKIALNLESLRNRITGLTPEQSMARERTRRGMDIELGPQETSAKEQAESQSAVSQARGFQLREMEERQRMAAELRRLQLMDQYARRGREEELYKQLHGPSSALGSMVGGGLLGSAAGSIGRRAAGAGLLSAGAGKALKGLGPLGAGLGLAHHLLGASGPSRPLIRMERERYTPSTMVQDVR